NDAPVADDEVVGDIAEDSGPLVIDASVLLSGDTDVDGDTLTVTSVTAVMGGAVSLSGSTITFTPLADYYGPASFTYTVSDGNGGTDTATASFNITPVDNDDPAFDADSASVSVAENTTAVGAFVAEDPDQTGPIYSLSGVNAAYFTINSATGELSFINAPDYEALTVNPLYVTVIATDADNNLVTDQIDVTVTVTNVAEPGDDQPPEEEPEEPPPNPNPGGEEPDPLVLLDDAFRNIMRYEVDTKYRPLVDALAEQVTDGDMTLDEAIGEIVDWADGTTAVATLAYQFFGDAVPTAAGLDWLVAPDGPNPNSLNEDYYASFSLDSRFINFAVNLGKQGTTGQAFALEYGAMSVDDAAKAIYLEIFGFAADQAKIDALMDGQVSNGLGGTMTREAYLRSISGGDDLGLKAAFAGWLLSYAATADEGVYADANEAFLMDIADGGTYNVDIVGVYAEG
ncbi:MAG TPA: cadherin-like domain-containing protein, partial [Phenylobacterium sp.]|nr:cadherin-like domain-containing protein [Phenylobacterium sp.]